MCRISDFEDFPPKRGDSLNIKAFFVRFSCLKSIKPLPDSLTLLYLPRINGAELFVDGSKIRPESSAVLTLHRVVGVTTKEGEAIFGSRSGASATGGLRFQVFMGDDRVLDGIFIKDEEEWKLECECGLESHAVCGLAEEAKAEADVCVALEGQVALIRRVEMGSKRRQSRRKGGVERLEPIPEESEDEAALAENESNAGGCHSNVFCGPDYEMDLDLEGVRWAVDVGIWVMCLGAGYFVSKASARKLRRLRLL